MINSTLSTIDIMKTGRFGPEDRTNVSAPKISTYIKSKTFAEKVA
jgi:hypothetical protein